MQCTCEKQIRSGCSCHFAKIFHKITPSQQLHERLQKARREIFIRKAMNVLMELNEESKQFAPNPTKYKEGGIHSPIMPIDVEYPEFLKPTTKTNNAL